jgi:plastocyanin
MQEYGLTPRIAEEESMHTRLWSSLAALILMASGTGMAWGNASASAPARVQINDVGPSVQQWHFEPRDVSITPGTTVIWHNAGQQAHTVTADDKSFDSGGVAAGHDWQWTFQRAGDFVYHCTPHPWMKATIHVH